MKSVTLDTLDFRDEGACEHCFVDRLKKAFDDRYLAHKPEYDLVLVSEDQAKVMRKISTAPTGARIDMWWGVPVLVAQ